METVYFEGDEPQALDTWNHKRNTDQLAAFVLGRCDHVGGIEDDELDL